MAIITRKIPAQIAPNLSKWGSPSSFEPEEVHGFTDFNRTFFQLPPSRIPMEQSFDKRLHNNFKHMLLSSTNHPLNQNLLPYNTYQSKYIMAIITRKIPAQIVPNLSKWGSPSSFGPEEVHGFVPPNIPSTV
ncbi:hypothetical protein CDAR_459281 [Caerostris darwini]|uniref:Uncharacterized protein n=1 Tax=Caerostris darwini TaxID=1538125 RepID=A0AAV4PI55_9ARAC|nr:hypothetical protein CDAR_459281 [Caerostris darwini]